MKHEIQSPLDQDYLDGYLERVLPPLKKELRRKTPWFHTVSCNEIVTVDEGVKLEYHIIFYKEKTKHSRKLGDKK